MLAQRKRKIDSLTFYFSKFSAFWSRYNWGKVQVKLFNRKNFTFVLKFIKISLSSSVQKDIFQKSLKANSGFVNEKTKGEASVGDKQEKLVMNDEFIITDQTALN